MIQASLLADLTFSTTLLVFALAWAVAVGGVLIRRLRRRTAGLKGSAGVSPAAEPKQSGRDARAPLSPTGGVLEGSVGVSPAAEPKESGRDAHAPLRPTGGVLEGSVGVSPAADDGRCEGIGRVPIHHYRRVDWFGVAWILTIYTWLALAQVAMVTTMGDEERTLRSADIVVSILFQGFMGLTVIVIMWPRIRPVDWLGLRPASWRPVFLFAPASVAVMWIVFAMLQTAGYVDWIESLGVETVQDSVRILQTERNFPLLGLMAFAAVVVAPICEEIVFRGYLYAVAKRYCGPIAGALASSLAFAAAHASLVAMLPLALFGLLLAWLYERTGTIWAPIAAHACFNGATVAIQLAIR